MGTPLCVWVEFATIIENSDAIDVVIVPFEEIKIVYVPKTIMDMNISHQKFHDGID